MNIVRFLCFGASAVFAAVAYFIPATIKFLAASVFFFVLPFFIDAAKAL